MLRVPELWLPILNSRPEWGNAASCSSVGETDVRTSGKGTLKEGAQGLGHRTKPEMQHEHDVSLVLAAFLWRTGPQKPVTHKPESGRWK